MKKNRLQQNTRSVLRFIPLFVIAVMWIAFSFPYLFKGAVPFPSSYLVTFFPPWNATNGKPVKNNAMPDVISQIYPWKSLTVASWKRGVIPLWNPYSFSGTPHAANYQSAVFSPVTILFFLFPFLDAWSIAILLQPLLAASGMYLFLRALERSRASSLIGSIAFMFCGFMTVWMAYGTLGYAALVLPWLFLSVFKSFSTPSRVFRIAIALAAAFSFASGHFQISLYVVAATGVFIAYMAITTKNYRRALEAFVALLCGAGIAAPQLILTFNAFTDSVRSSLMYKGEIIPWRYAITALFPDFYGNPVTRNDWFGHYAEWASYIGTIPLLSAVFTLRYFKKPFRIFFWCMAICSVFFAYASPFSDALYSLKIPVLSTSAASRIIILFSFSMAVLSAFGIDDLRVDWTRGYKKFAALIAAAVVLLFAGIITYLFVFRPFDVGQLGTAKRNMVLPGAFAVLFLGIGASGFLRSEKIRKTAVVLAILITGFDLYRFASKWMPFDSRQDVYPPVASIEYLQKHAGISRIFGNIGNESGGIFSLQLIEGYDAMYKGRYGEFMQAVSSGRIEPGGRSVVTFDKHGLYRDEALKLLGVRYIYHRKSDGRNIWAFPYWEFTQKGTMRQVYSDNDYWIYEYTDAYPRAFLVTGYAVRATDDEIISTMFSPDTDLRTTVILEKEPGIRPGNGEGTADITQYSADTVTIRTSSLTANILFISDQYDEGWNVTIDGKPAPLLRADYAFRAVAVPSGDHTVTMRYDPWAMHFGLLITGVSIAVLMVMVWKKHSI